MVDSPLAIYFNNGSGAFTLKNLSEIDASADEGALADIYGAK